MAKKPEYGLQVMRVLAGLMLLAWAPLAAEEEMKTVIGPRNIALSEGAEALLANDGEEGVRLTLIGLKTAHGSRERKAALSNLCAGYLMIDQPRTALEYCNEAVEQFPDFWRAYNNRALVFLRLDRFEESEADIRRGQELRPSAETLKIAKGLLLDETDPVRGNIEIDERRSISGDDREQDPNE
jgi:tetratricopeptide (TPR) repeat protein